MEYSHSIFYSWLLPAANHRVRWCLCFIVFHSFSLSAQDSIPPRTPGDYKKLSLEELMDIEVTSVSKSPQKLAEVASAIQVITNEDIRRSAFTRLPEVLRLAPNLMVAQSNSHDWGITSRGFNGAPLTNTTLANKLLVMIDGRTVYTPLFGGVFWDVQNVLLEDIDRIEVVSGPGGTLWGANAVNGVINVISKSARESQGLYATAAAGNFLQDHMGLRYGGKLSDRLYFRVYGQRFDQRNTDSIQGTSVMDSWSMTQGGFRMDYDISDKNTLTVQGDLYGGSEDHSMGDEMDGQNILANWSHRYRNNSGIYLRAYYDRAWRRISASGFRNEVQTYDLDFHHNFSVAKKHQLLWGIGYRFIQGKTNATETFSFNPVHRNMPLVNAFVQDQIGFMDDHLQLTVGTKLLHNVFTGYELQPSVRMAWVPDSRNTLWGAVSRAVRTPSRLDADLVLANLASPGSQFKSEKVLAYELGYRWEPHQKVSLSFATFLNKYSDLRTINLNTAGPPNLIFANDQQARSTGFELSGNFYASEKWRVRAGYTYLFTEFEYLNDLVQPFSAELEAVDPKNQLMFQSILDLFKGFQLDVAGRYVHMLQPTLTSPPVPTYFTFNVRAAWHYQHFVFSLSGQNLADKEHAEFGAAQLPRSFYGRVTCRF